MLRQPVSDARGRDARLALDVRPELRERLQDGVIGYGKIIDVLISRAVEAATKQEPHIVVDERHPGFVGRAELFGVFYSARISSSPLDSLASAFSALGTPLLSLPLLPLCVKIPSLSMVLNCRNGYAFLIHAQPQLSQAPSCDRRKRKAPLPLSP